MTNLFDEKSLERIESVEARLWQGEKTFITFGSASRMVIIFTIKLIKLIVESNPWSYAHSVYS